MYSITEPLTLNCIHDIFSAYSRIGDHVNIAARPDSIELSCINSSLTVIGKITIHRPAFSGPGTNKTVHIKSKASDFIFRRIESDHFTSLKLEFTTSSQGHESLEIVLSSDFGIRKTFKLPCLNTTNPSANFAPLEVERYSFECLPSMLKSAFASTESSADEVKVTFKSRNVTMHARKRGKTVADNPVMRTGLKTIINFPLESFKQITAQTTWQIEFKLKELRIILAFLDQLGEDVLLRAEFNSRGVTTPIDFSVKPATFPDMDFSFRFMGRINDLRRAEIPQFLQIGRQPAWVYEKRDQQRLKRRLMQTDELGVARIGKLHRQKRLRDQNVNVNATAAVPAAVHVSHDAQIQQQQETRQEQEQNDQNVEAVEEELFVRSNTSQDPARASDAAPEPVPSPVPAPAPASASNASPNPDSPPQSSDEYDPQAVEVGLTQNVSQYRGLFD